MNICFHQLWFLTHQLTSDTYIQKHILHFKYKAHLKEMKTVATYILPIYNIIAQL